MTLAIELIVAELIATALVSFCIGYFYCRQANRKRVLMLVRFLTERYHATRKEANAEQRRKKDMKLNRATREIAEYQEVFSRALSTAYEISKSKTKEALL